MLPRLIVLIEVVVVLQSLVWTIPLCSCFSPASLALSPSFVVVAFHRTTGRSCCIAPMRKHQVISISHPTNSCGAGGFRRRSTSTPPARIPSSSSYYSSLSLSMRANDNKQRLDMMIGTTTALTKNHNHNNNNNNNNNNERIPSLLYATSSNNNNNHNKNGHDDEDENKIDAVDADIDNNNGDVPTHGFFPEFVKAGRRTLQLLIQQTKKRIQRGRTFLGRYNRTSTTKTQRILTKLRQRVILILGIVGFFTYYLPTFLAPYVLQLQSVPSHLDQAAAVRTIIHNDTLRYSSSIVQALAYLKSIKNDILYGDDLWP